MPESFGIRYAPLAPARTLHRAATAVTPISGEGEGESLSRI